MANQFNFKKVKPTSFSTPNLVRLDGFRTASTPSKGFVFKPLFAPKAKAAGWKDIETITGKKFATYAAAVGYINDLQHGKGGDKSAGGFVGNLFKGAVDTVVGLGPGLVALAEAGAKDVWGTATGDYDFSNTAKIGGAIVKDYKATYGPLAHGNFGEFWDNVYNNPIGPILDVASLVTLGAGAAVKGGSLAAKANIVSKTGKIANMGKAEALLARSPEAIRLGEKASLKNSEVFRMTSKNPVIRARQKLVYKGLTSSRVPKNLGVRLEERRYTGRLKKTQNKNMARETHRTAEGETTPALMAHDTARHIGLLHRRATPHEFAAAQILGLVGTHMTSHEAVQSAIRIAKEEGHPPPETELALWHHPETNKLIDKAVADSRSGKSNDIINLHHSIDRLSQVDAAQKGLDPNTIKARRWATVAHLKATPAILAHVEATIRQIEPSLAKETEAVAGLRRSVASNVLTHLYAKSYEAGMDMGSFLRMHEQQGTLPQLWSEIYKPIDAETSLKTRKINDAEFVEPAAKPGDINPIYIPHKTGITPQGHEGAGRGDGEMIKQNNKIVLKALRMAIGEDLMGHENARTLRNLAARQTHTNMIKSSVEVDGSDVTQMQANGYDLVAQIEGAPDDYMTKTSAHQIEKAFNNADEDIMGALRGVFTTKDMHGVFEVDGHKVLPARKGGKYLMIRKPLANQLIQEYAASGKWTKRFIEHPLTLWKYVVLGLSPRNIVTNVVGNTIMAGLLSQNPVDAMRVVVHSGLKTMTSEKVTAALTLKGSMGISDRFMRRVFPEHWQASFSHTELNIHGKAQHFAYAYRATHRNEIALRQAMFMNLIRHNDEVRDIYKQNRTGSKHTQGRWEAAAEEALRKNPRLRDEMSDQVDDALGNYRDFSNKERQLRKVMPFYSWYRHAGRTTKALTQRPTTMAGMAALGRYGASVNEEAFGNVPAFMKAFAPLGAGKDGHQIGMNTAGLNPFHALAEMAEGGKALVVDGNATESRSKLAGFLSPFITSGVEQLTGKSLLTGAPSKAPYGGHGGFLGGALSRVVAGTPEMRLGAATLNAMDDGPDGLGQLTPTGQLKKKKEPTLSKDLKTQLFNFAGFPYKDVNVNAAQEWQKTLDQEDVFHLPKPRKKKPKKHTLGSINFGSK